MTQFQVEVDKDGGVVVDMSNRKYILNICIDSEYIRISGKQKGIKPIIRSQSLQLESLQVL